MSKIFKNVDIRINQSIKKSVVHKKHQWDVNIKQMIR